MPGSYARLLYHILFATKGRTNAIKPEIQHRVEAFIGGIVRDKNATLIRFGGMPDNVHMLVRCPTDLCVADLVRHVKSRSCRWIHETFATTSSFA